MYEMIVDNSLLRRQKKRANIHTDLHTDKNDFAIVYMTNIYIGGLALPKLY